jgi:hypothetical protein
MSLHALSNNRDLGREFSDKYEASIVPSYRQYRRIKRATIADVQQWYATGMGTCPPDHGVEDVDMVDITIPYDRLIDLYRSQENYLHRREREEHRLREEYPALKSAWEQYQIVLAMVK